MKLGDLVRVFADNCYFGLGIIVGVTLYGRRVMTSDGKILYYLPNELEPVQPDSA